MPQSHMTSHISYVQRARVSHQKSKVHVFVTNFHTRYGVTAGRSKVLMPLSLILARVMGIRYIINSVLPLY